MVVAPTHRTPAARRPANVARWNRDLCLAFLRNELKARRTITCVELHGVNDGRYVELAGIVLVRQKPGSAKSVMFLTLEDEMDVANLVIWTRAFEPTRCPVLGPSMIGVRGQVQREGDLIYVIAHRLADLSASLRVSGTLTTSPASTG